MYKKSLQIIVLLLTAQVSFAQQLRDPLSAKNSAELELIFKDNFTIQQKVLIEKAATLNYPSRVELKNGTVREMVGISPTGMPIYVHTTNNFDAARTISTNRVWPGGTLGLNLTGAGMTNRMGVWDGGAVRLTHQEFQNRAVQTDGATTLSDHATHVAGTMSAGGVSANAKGMSFQAPIKCHDWNNDNSEMSSAASAGLLVSNHSYTQISGWQYNSSLTRWEFWGDQSISAVEDYKYGFYDNISAQWDQIAVNYPNYLPFVAAGNDRGEPGTIPASFYVRNTNGNWVLGNSANPPAAVGPFNSINGGPGNAKNVLTVGAVNKIITGWQNANNVVMSSFSGWGPTDDGRIKPDVVANGVSVFSPISTSNTAYDTYNGTSMATPNASGSALLVQQHYNNLKGSFMKASTLKGLIIHTADEAGTSIGPDYTFGWGLMNTAKAVTVISDTAKNLILQNTLNNVSSYNFTFFSDGTSPIRATICWTDRPGSSPNPSLNPITKMLVNDLDIRVRRNSDNQIFSPYVLNRTTPTAAATTGDNTIDNVEQVQIAAPVAGTYTITISKKGSLVGSTQDYALIISGITPKPTAAFTTANRVICTARTTLFTDQSSGASNRMWYFLGGTPSTSTALNPIVSYAIPGIYPVALRISSATGYDSVYRDDYITVGGMALPLNETFELNSTTKNTWSIDNPNNDTTWRLFNVGGTTPGNTAYGINNYDFPTNFYLDRLVSPVLDLRGYQNASLSFQHAYTRYDKTSSDSLIIYVSTNCGTSYTKIASFGENGKGNFATALDTNLASTNRFIPNKAADWCGGGIGAGCITLNLTPFVGFHNVRIRFEQKSDAGNNMYLDNINITGTPNAPIANFYSILKTVCVGDELQLLDSSLNKPDSWNWYFTDADTLTSIIRNPKVKFLTPGLKTISLAVKNVNGKDSVTRVSYINILPSPAPPGIASSNGLNLCNGDSTVLSTDATSGFIWYKDNLIYSTSLTSFKVKDEANFYVKQLGTGGCTANSPTLFVQTGISPPVPTITKDLSGNNFCDGGVFNLSSSSLTNNQWFVNDTLFIGAVSKNLSSTEAGKFKVRVNDKICFSFSDSLVIIKLDKPNTSPIVGTTWAVKGDTALFSVVPGISGSIFTWTPVGATILSGAGTKDVSLKMGIGASASVNIQETSSAGCSGDKKSLSVNLVSTSVVKFANSFGIAIYPNPANKSLQISSDKLSNELMDIQIINLLGQTMMHIQGSFNTNSQIKEINIESLPPSLYIIQIKIGNRNLTDRFTKE